MATAAEIINWLNHGSMNQLGAAHIIISTLSPSERQELLNSYVNGSEHSQFANDVLSATATILNINDAEFVTELRGAAALFDLSSSNPLIESQLNQAVSNLVALGQHDGIFNASGEFISQGGSSSGSGPSGGNPGHGGPVEGGPVEGGPVGGDPVGGDPERGDPFGGEPSGGPNG